jgi:hypothetical protein
MNSKPTKEHVNAFVEHVVATLPDSLRLRKICLVTLESLLPRDYPGRHQLAKLTETLRAHEGAQLHFHWTEGDGK